MSAAAVDALVVGGGPAGSTAARLLALAGWRVLLLERAAFPRAKACGECVNPGAVSALARLGVLDAVEACGPARLAGWRLETGRRCAVGTFPDGRYGLALARADLDHALLEAARSAGVEVRHGLKVTGLAPRDAGGDPTGPGVVVRDPDGRASTLRAGVVVGADGLRSTVARALDAYRRGPRLRKLSVTVHVEDATGDLARGRLAFDDRGTVGMAPLDPDGRRWNATVVVDADRDGRAAAGDPMGFALGRLAEVLGAGWSGRPVAGPWTSGPFDWPSRRATADGVVLVGDAAGYYDPLTGQGIYRALRSAELALPVLDAALRSARTARADLAPYEIALRRELRAPLRMQRAVETVIASRSIRPAAVAVLGHAERMMDTLIGVTGDMSRARALLRPSVWLPTSSGSA